LQKYSKELKRILTDILIRKKEQMSNATGKTKTYGQIHRFP